MEFARGLSYRGNVDTIGRAEVDAVGRASDLYLIGVNPLWDPLRDDARFRQVLRRLNLD